MQTNISVKMGRGDLSDLLPFGEYLEPFGTGSRKPAEPGAGCSAQPAEGRRSLAELTAVAGNIPPAAEGRRSLYGTSAGEIGAKLPAGYRFRLFVPGDEAHWARIETAAGEFAAVDDALSRFRDEFGASVDDMRERCLFIENKEGGPIGTATAWRKTIAGESFGRLHWVAIVPEEQGRKLAKPLVAAALSLLAAKHGRAMLTSQTSSWKAIKMYLDFGFVPLIDGSDGCSEAWRWLERQLGRAILPSAIEEDAFFERREA